MSRRRDAFGSSWRTLARRPAETAAASAELTAPAGDDRFQHLGAGVVAGPVRGEQGLTRGIARAYLLEGNLLAVDVPKGTLITRRMVVPPADSVLWSLRQKQDEVFLANSDVPAGNSASGE